MEFYCPYCEFHFTDDFELLAPNYLHHICCEQCKQFFWMVLTECHCGELLVSIIRKENVDEYDK
jgi:hypothetical protein